MSRVVDPGLDEGGRKLRIQNSAIDGIGAERDGWAALSWVLAGEWRGCGWRRRLCGGKETREKGRCQCHLRRCQCARTLEGLWDPVGEASDWQASGRGSFLQPLPEAAPGGLRQALSPKSTLRPRLSPTRDPMAYPFPCPCSKSMGRNDAQNILSAPQLPPTTARCRRQGAGLQGRRSIEPPAGIRPFGLRLAACQQEAL